MNNVSEGAKMVKNGCWAPAREGNQVGIDPNQKSICALAGEQKKGGAPKKEAPIFEPTLGSTFGHDFVHEKAVLLARLLGISLG